MHVVMARRPGSWWAGGAWRGLGGARQQEGNQYESCGSPAAPPEGRMLHIVGPWGWSRLPHLERGGLAGWGEGKVYKGELS